MLGRYNGRQRYITVPCGHCVECARAKRNEWFVRLWSTYCVLSKMGIPTWFVTVTIDPKLWPNMTLDSPGIADRISPFVRSWTERLRYLNYGKMPLRFLCSEFGSKGESYIDSNNRIRISTGALHFHGLLFGNLPLRRISAGLSLTHGHVKFERIKGPQCIRYTVKYATKDYSVEDPKLRARTFASPGLGVPSFYFGNNPATNIVTINGFHYKTPRYLKDLQWLILYSRFKYGVSDKLHLSKVRKEIVTPFGHTLISLESAKYRCCLSDRLDAALSFYADADPVSRKRFYSQLERNGVHFCSVSELQSMVSMGLVGPGHPDLRSFSLRQQDLRFRCLLGSDSSFGDTPLRERLDVLKNFLIT